MSYLTYTTEALVCGAINQNTADRIYRLFTREMGMLYASAKSVREERSRQRYALQEFSHIRVSLIRGKNMWKVGSVESINNDYDDAISREARGSVAIIYRTLRRFIQGEEASVELFDFCQEALTTLTSELKRRTAVELYVQIRILLFLGYLSEEVLPLIIREAPMKDVADLVTVKQESELQQLIATATLNSQL